MIIILGANHEENTLEKNPYLFGQYFLAVYTNFCW